MIEITKEIKEKLVEMGLDPNASDDDARRFIEENNIEIVVEKEDDYTEGEVRQGCADPAGSGKRITVSATDEEMRKIEFLSYARRLGQEAYAAQELKKGKSIREIATGMLERSSKVVPVTASANIGLSEKEKKTYSFRKLINAMATNDWKDAGFERECSQAAAKQIRANPRGAFVPMDILQSQRDYISITKPSGSAGGNLVATDLLADNFIDVLRARMVLPKLGVTMLTGLVGNIALPKQSSASTAYFVADGTDITESDLGFKQVVLSPKNIGVNVKYTRQLLLQSSPSIEALVRNDLFATTAAGIENAVLNGTGSGNQPRGLLNISTIPKISMGENGAAISWAAVVAMETAVSDANVYDDGTMAYLVNSKTRGLMKTVEKFPNTGYELYRSQGVNQPGDVNGYPGYMTNFLPSNGTKGTGENLSTAIFGRWSDLVIGLWGVLDLVVDPYTLAQQGGIRVIAYQSFDVATRHDESFAICTDIDTSSLLLPTA